MTGTTYTITGVDGMLKWNYREVAVLGPWTITMTGKGLDLTAHVVGEVDQYATTMQPSALTFFGSRQTTGVRWRWPVTSLQIANGTLHACLTQTE